ncbi:MAG: hypothetical protein VB018_15165 [Lachnospiraceae bacterium]|nr:hypothetical protein [Lachnospiraceae bacterium]
MIKNKRTYQHKRYTTAKKYLDNTLGDKKERMIVKLYVSVLMILFSLAIANVNNPKAEKLQLSLKTAISQSITAQQAKEISQKGIEKIMTFKGNDVAKKVEDTVEEVFLPNDAATVN